MRYISDLKSSRIETSNVWIAGSGRSGTTWLSRMLTAVNHSKLIYEPLHPDHVSFLKSLNPPMSHTDERPYIRPDDKAEIWATFVKDLFAGRYQNTWTRFAGMNKMMIPGVWLHSLFPRIYVVKSIRSNLLLGWLSRNPNYKVIYLLRHPCATLLSQQRLNWGVNLSLLISNAELRAHYFEKHNTFFNQDLSKLSQRAVQWGIENSVPIQQIRDGHSIYLMTYEELVSDPFGQIRSLLRFLGWDLDDLQLRRIESRIHVGFSGLRHPRSKSEMLSGWTRKLSKEQIIEILKIVHRLGVNIYDEDMMPRADARLKLATTDSS